MSITFSPNMVLSMKNIIREKKKLWAPMGPCFSRVFLLKFSFESLFIFILFFKNKNKIRKKIDSLFRKNIYKNQI